MTTRPRILFVPAHFGVPSHLIPLVKLHEKLDLRRYESAFFMPRISPTQMKVWKVEQHNPHAGYYYSEAFLSRFKIPSIATCQNSSVNAEMAAYAEFSPDLIIDDCSVTTALARQIRPVPRVTVLRTGVFEGPVPRPKEHRHSADPVYDSLRVPSRSPFRLPSSLQGYYQAEGHIVPGVRSLERIPHSAESAACTRFCGPLLLDRDQEILFEPAGLRDFIGQNAGRRLAYVTFGVVSAKSAHPIVAKCCEWLLTRGFSLVTNIGLNRYLGEGWSQSVADRCFIASAFPMHYVCSKVDLVIHVCSSSAYHYPILNGKPAITVGTQYYDREEIAQNLASLQLSRHLPAPEATDEFEELFQQAVDDFLDGRAPFDAGLLERLDRHRREMRESAERFDLNDFIGRTLAQSEVGHDLQTPGLIA